MTVDEELRELPGREAFLERMELETERFRRYNTSLALALLQVEQPPDSAENDELVEAVGRTIRTNLRSCDTVGRYGGDVLGVLLPEQTKACAVAAIDRIRAAVEAHPVQLPGDIETKVVLCYGLADFVEENVIEGERLITQAQAELDAKTGAIGQGS